MADGKNENDECQQNTGTSSSEFSSVPTQLGKVPSEVLEEDRVFHEAMRQAAFAQSPDGSGLLEDSDAEFFSDVSVQLSPGTMGETEADVVDDVGDDPGHVGPSFAEEVDPVGLDLAESEVEWELNGPAEISDPHDRSSSDEDPPAQAHSKASVGESPDYEASPSSGLQVRGDVSGDSVVENDDEEDSETFEFRSPSEGRMRKPNVYEHESVESGGVEFEAAFDDDATDFEQSGTPQSVPALRSQFLEEIRTSLGVATIAEEPSFSADRPPLPRPKTLFKKLLQGNVPRPETQRIDEVDATEQEGFLEAFRERFEQKRASFDSAKFQRSPGAKRRDWTRDLLSSPRLKKQASSGRPFDCYVERSEASEANEVVRVPVSSDFKRRSLDGGAARLISSENEILRLYRDFMIVMRRCGLATRPVDFGTFSDKVTSQREKARRRYGGGELIMEVKVTSGKPVISIRPK